MMVVMAAADCGSAPVEMLSWQRGPHQRYDFFSRQNGAGCKEWINPEEDVYGIVKFIGPGIIGFYKEEEKQNEAGYLACPAPQP